MDKVPITNYESKIANEESAYLYGHLRKKYCNTQITNSALDICLNSLCFALLRMIHEYVPPKDREIFIEKIIMRILMEGIEK
jgi:hypothetical protein